LTLSAAAMATFKYKSLRPSNTRLITLLPADNENDENDDIRVGLVTTRLNGPLPYTALSYTWGTPYEVLRSEWGDPNLTKRIFANGLEFTVQWNLHSALTHLRAVKSNEMFSRLFWIDAICIDQSEIGERNQQVRFMKDVYTNAEDTII
jgi:hypothetical protein